MVAGENRDRAAPVTDQLLRIFFHIPLRRSQIDHDKQPRFRRRGKQVEEPGLHGCEIRFPVLFPQFFQRDRRDEETESRVMKTAETRQMPLRSGPGIQHHRIVEKYGKTPRPALKPRETVPADDFCLRGGRFLRETIQRFRAQFLHLILRFRNIVPVIPILPTAQKTAEINHFPPCMLFRHTAYDCRRLPSRIVEARPVPALRTLFRAFPVAIRNPDHRLRLSGKLHFRPHEEPRAADHIQHLCGNDIRSRLQIFFRLKRRAFEIYGTMNPPPVDPDRVHIISGKIQGSPDRLFRKLELPAEKTELILQTDFRIPDPFRLRGRRFLRTQLRRTQQQGRRNKTKTRLHAVTSHLPQLPEMPTPVLWKT